LINPTDIENISAANPIDLEITSNELQLLIPNYGCPAMFTLCTFSTVACMYIYNYVIKSSLLFISNFILNIFGITYFCAGKEHPDS